ncbi:hypothetical protein Franean1_2599 [Parafrankia sp. EAN1pec]|uniref:hypothetical protein n=1 Tax=Parafrankia sp. (strain EAN1pec) TaxID=298653 RepID=UPI0000541139|nr:hypothetical protein Franean1_2599 [Frankia sp. EAN1pec]
MAEEELAAALSFVGDGATGWVYGFANGEERVHVTYSDVPGPWIYHVEGRMVHGKPAITSLAIAPRDADSPEAITRNTVRRAPTGTMLGRVKSALREKWGNKVADLGLQARIQSVKRGRSWPAEHFLQVAWFCIDAELTDRAPRQVIKDQWGVSEITASRWLARARELGYLPDYPISPATGRFEGHDQTDATHLIEEQIVEKVFREGLTGARSPSEVSTAIGEILHRLVFGSSEEARSVQTDIFIEELERMVEDFPDVQIRAAAEQLFDLLAREEPPSTG